MRLTAAATAAVAVAARRDDPVRSCKLSLYTVLYTEIFRKLHSVRTLYVVCEVAFVLVCDEVL